jgi:4-hydroxy-tetrahydrodipicolinate synthase
MEEVPDVIGVKQSAGDLKLFADLILAAKPKNLIFSAVDALLYSSYSLGAHGAIAAILSAAPGPSVKLWEAVQDNDHNTASQLHKQLLNLWNALMPDNNLPASTKFCQKLQGLPSGLSREPMSESTADQKEKIKAALKKLGLT